MNYILRFRCTRSFHKKVGVASSRRPRSYLRDPVFIRIQLRWGDTVDCVKRTGAIQFYSFGEIQRMQICSDFEEYSLKSAVFRSVILGNIMTPLRDPSSNRTINCQMELAISSTRFFSVCQPTNQCCCSRFLDVGGETETYDLCSWSLIARPSWKYTFPKGKGRLPKSSPPSGLKVISSKKGLPG